MADTSIEWTQKVWNPVRGCSRVSRGCERCYAEKQAHRFSGTGQPYEGLTKLTSDGPRWTGIVRFVPDQLNVPMKWRKPVRVFVNSMSDLFHESLDFEDIWKVFDMMSMAHQFRGHIFQILTKRPARMKEFVEWVAVELRKIKESKSGMTIAWPPLGVWLGVSVEDQKSAEERIPILLETPALIRWLSVEPLLGPVLLKRWLDKGIHWVVAGGESGHGARPMHPRWARVIRDHCEFAGVPFFFKQWGNWISVDQLEYIMQQGERFERRPKEYWFDDCTICFEVGKKFAGRLLDGREHNEYPNTAPIG